MSAIGSTVILKHLSRLMCHASRHLQSSLINCKLANKATSHNCQKPGSLHSYCSLKSRPQSIIKKTHQTITGQFLLQGKLVIASDSAKLQPSLKMQTPITTVEILNNSLIAHSKEKQSALASISSSDGKNNH